MLFAADALCKYNSSKSHSSAPGGPLEAYPSSLSRKPRCSLAPAASCFLIAEQALFVIWKAMRERGEVRTAREKILEIYEVFIFSSSQNFATAWTQ